jgi:hypothetical protein
MVEEQDFAIAEKLRMEEGTSKTSTSNTSNGTASYSIRLNLKILKSRSVSASRHVSHLAGPQFESSQCLSWTARSVSLWQQIKHN